MTKEQEETSRLVVRQWKSAALELERVRNEELRDYVYDWMAVDAMLDFGLRHAQSRKVCGLVEMQRLVMKAKR